MNVGETIKYYQRQVNALRKRLEWLEANRETIDAIGVEVSLISETIDLDNPTRDQVLQIIKAFGAGEWEKTPSAHDPATIDYVTEIDGMTLRMYAAPPPPSCRVVEEWVDVPAVPATRVKKLKLECKPELVGAV